MSLYPTVPIEEIININPSAFRMGRIVEVKALLQKERDDRIDISKKYKRTANFIEGVNTLCAASSVISGSGSILATTTVIGTPIALGLGISAATSRLLCMIGQRIILHLKTKSRKHDRIVIAAMAKMNSIDVIVSEAIRDNKISDAEFKIVCDELDRYLILKEEIRNKCKVSPKTLSNVHIEKLIKEGRADERKKVLRQLSE